MRKSLLLLLTLTTVWIGAQSNTYVAANSAAAPIAERTLTSSFVSLNSSTVFGKFLRGMLIIDRAPGCETDIVVNQVASATSCVSGVVTWPEPSPNPVVTTPTDTLFIRLTQGDTIKAGDPGFSNVINASFPSLPIGNYRVEYRYTVSTSGPVPGVCNVLINITDGQAPNLDISGVYSGPLFSSNDTVFALSTDSTCFTAKDGINIVELVDFARPVVLDDCDNSSNVSYIIEDAFGNVLASDDTLTALENDLLGSTQDTLLFPVGSNLIIYTAYDTTGNTTTDTLVLFVEDLFAPIFSDTLFNNPVSLFQDSVDTDLGQATASVTYLIPTADDNCAVQSYSWRILDPNVFPVDTLARGTGNNIAASLPIGLFLVEYDATDAYMNTELLGFSVEVFDNEAPTVICPNDEFDGPYLVNATSCTINFATESVAGRDNVSNNLQVIWQVLDTDTMTVINSGSVTSPTTFDNITATINKAGRYAVRQWVLDLDKMSGDAGFSSDTCIAFFSVIDNFAPVLSNLPNDTTIYTLPVTGCVNNYTPSTPDLNDNCTVLADSSRFLLVRMPGNDTVWNTNTAAPLQSFQAVFGDTTNVTYNYSFHFEDPSGNDVDFSYVISVRDTVRPMLNTAVFPIASKDATINVFNTCDTSYTLPTKSFTFSDNCSNVSSLKFGNTELIIRNAANTADSIASPVVNLTDTLNVFRFTATDVSGNFRTDSIRIFKRDVKRPVLNGNTPYADIEEVSSATTCDYIYSVSSLSNVLNVMDNCGIDSVWLDIRNDLEVSTAIDSVIGFKLSDLSNPFSFAFSADTLNDALNARGDSMIHSVTVRARDLEGNMSMPVIPGDHTFIITVHDTVRPQIFLQDTITYFVNSADCQSVTILSTDPRADLVAQGLLTVFDNCQSDANLLANMRNNNPASALVGDSLFGNFPLGNTTVTFTTHDGNNNRFSNSLIVSVIDTVAPNAVLSTVRANTNDSTCTATITINSPVTIDDDNCGVDSIAYSLNGTTYIGLDSINSSFENTFALDTTTIFWRSFDAAGNSTDFSTLVIITDNVKPTLMLSNSALQYFTSAGSCDRTITLPSANPMDNCGIDTVYSFLISTEGTTVDTTVFKNTPVTALFKRRQIGVTRNYRLETVALDVNGNLSDTLRNIITLRDTIKPTINKIDTVFLDVETGKCTATITLDSAGQAYGLNVNDDCGINNIVYNELNSIVNFNDTTFEAVAGTYDFEINVFDSSEIQNFSTYEFTIVVRNNFANRVISAPADTVTANVFANECSRNVTFDSLIVRNCGDRYSIVSSVPNGSLFPIGTTNVSWYIINLGDTLFTYNFVVNVIDNQAPVIKQAPQDVILYVGVGCTVQYNYVLDVQDNCDAQGLTVQTSVPSGTSLTVGTFTNNYSVTDESGNMVSGSNLITVLDTVTPGFSSFPQNIVSCNPIVNYTVTGVDNCSGVTTTLTAGLASGNTFPAGVTTVTYTVTDASGNTFSKSFTVEIMPGATVANAGNNADVCINAGFNLNGNATATGETGTWTVTPDIANIAAVNNPQTAVTFNSAGVYTFTWTIDNGQCTPNSDDVVVIVSDLAIADAGGDFEVAQPSASLDAVTDNGSIIWTVNTSATINSPNSERTQVSGLEVGDNVFTITVNNPVCGDANDMVTVTYTPAGGVDFRDDIVGAFTPNNDGINDLWELPGISAFPNATVLVVNRNGNTVFETNSPATEFWDGTNEGEELPVASYYYVIDLGDGTSPIEGTVSIIK